MTSKFRLRRRLGPLPVWAWAAIAFLLGAIAVGSASSNQDTQAQPTDPPTTPSPTTTSPPTTVRATTTTKPAPTTTTTTIPIIESGVYIVGLDIQPGAYRVTGYFARLDSNMEIIENDGVYGANELTYVEVQGTDAYLELSGEAIAIADFPVYDPILVGARRGTYLVGVDIQPGRYRIDDPDYAYAARLSCDRDIIDNEGNAGNVIIIVRDTDCLLQYSGVISRID